MSSIPIQNQKTPPIHPKRIHQGRPEPAQAIWKQLFQTSPWDALMVCTALAQGGLSLTLLFWATQWPAPILALLFAFGICWNANTVSHNHLHNPFFRARWMNRGFCLYLTLLTGIPQSIWKERHLWHHAGEPEKWRKRGLTSQKIIEFSGLGLLWATLLWLNPAFFLKIYLPGFLLGLLFCQLQGHYEHAHERQSGGGVSHYGPIYNFFWFNDGYHIEHHNNARTHWRDLPRHRVCEADATISTWSPHLRWMEKISQNPLHSIPHLLGDLERLALRHPWLQRWMIHTHQQAFFRLLNPQPHEKLKHIAIIGGGLFPRTLLALQALYPQSAFTIIDHDPTHLQQAREYLKNARKNIDNIHFVEGSFRPDQRLDTDLLIIPLAFVGDRSELYKRSHSSMLLIHDWLWHNQGTYNTTISVLLLKRLNLVLPEPDAHEALDETSTLLRQM